MCGKSCFDKSILKQHIATVHTTGQEYVCDKCGSTYANLFALRGKVSILWVDPLLPFFAWLYWSEALIFASTNPQYDKKLFMELPWKLQV